MNEIHTGLYDEVDKIDHLEDFVKNAVDDMPIVKTVTGLFDNSTYGLSKAINDYGKGKLLDIAWDGRSNTSNSRLFRFPDMCFKNLTGESSVSQSWAACKCIAYYQGGAGGNLSNHRAYEKCIEECLYQDDKNYCGWVGGGDLETFTNCERTNAPKKGTWYTDSSYRSCIRKINVTTNLNGDGILRPGTETVSSNKEYIPFRENNKASAPVSYEGETVTESLSTNGRIFLAKNFEDSQGTLATTRKQAQDAFGSPERNLTTLVDRVKYSGLNLVTYDRFGG